MGLIVLKPDSPTMYRNRNITKVKPWWRLYPCSLKPNGFVDSCNWTLGRWSHGVSAFNPLNFQSFQYGEKIILFSEISGYAKNFKTMLSVFYNYCLCSAKKYLRISFKWESWRFSSRSFFRPFRGFIRWYQIVLNIRLDIRICNREEELIKRSQIRKVFKTWTSQCKLIFPHFKFLFN